MKQRAPTACHSQKKDIGISNYPWVVYIYIYAQPPPKQKKNRTMGIAGSPMGLVSSVFLVLFFSLFVFLFFWFSPRSPPQRVSTYVLLVQ